MERSPPAGGLIFLKPDTVDQMKKPLQELARKPIQSIRGMHDILPGDITRWQWLESRLRKLFARYGYAEIRTPMVEFAEVFRQAMGVTTDVVEKEMYTFEDRNGDALCLRPEGTAGVVRSVVQHGLLNPPGLKVWYHGPMFRHERPQKGRQRQFHQFGVEVFGIAPPAIDVELILLAERAWAELGIASRVRLEINSLGSNEDRKRYRAALVDYLEAHRDRLDADSVRRLETNPLRILDSKHPETREVVQGAPRLPDALTGESAERFSEVQRQLDVLGVAYEVNPFLVRGLDYYCDTVFEWVTDDLGSQGTICAGGRYDGLVALQGGRETPGIGFALGVERLVELLALNGPEPVGGVDVYLVCGVDPAHALKLGETLRAELPELRVQVDTAGGSFKAQFKRADRSGARFALVLGESEATAGTVRVKDLRGDMEQPVGQAELAQWLRSSSDPGPELNIKLD